MLPNVEVFYYLKISQFRKETFKSLATFHNRDDVALRKELLGYILSRSYVVSTLPL